MQIYEVKNNTAEILYAPSDNSLFLSDFLHIEDDKFATVSQVTNISTTENPNVNKATVQFLLSVDKTGKLTKYNGHMPSKTSVVKFLEAKEITGLFCPKYNELIWGSYARDEELKVKTDLNFLSSGCAIICDRTEQSTVIVNKIVQSLKKNNSRFLLLDFDGKYQTVKAQTNAVFGQDYRIPLDSRALDYIFENDLNDCPIEAKAIIQSVILEIQKYAESAGFIPFEMFLNIIMQECKSCNNSGLMIFANKLLKYRQKKIFADNQKQFSLINNCSSSLKIDLSQIDESFYPLIFSSIITDIKKKFYVIADIDEENTTPSVLKYIYEKQNIRLVPVIRHDNKYLNKIKTQISNLAVFAPVSKQEPEEHYGMFLEKISNDEFILWGENTLFIPIIVSLSALLDNFKNGNYTTADDISEEDLDDLDRINLMAAKEMIMAEKITEEDLDFISVPKQQQEIVEEEETSKYQIIEEDDNSSETAETEEISPTIMEEEEEEEENNVPEIVENQEIQYEQPIQTEQPVQDIPAQNTPVQPVQQNIREQEPPEPKKPMPNPDTIPVYEPKEPETQAAVTFQEGDRVSHAKYGNGIVEKIIKYGKKTLCSILFEQTGRRLLDPNVTIIEKL